MYDDDDDMWSPTEADANNTKCSECGAKYQVVRPGKIQPSCLCDAYRQELDQHAETRRQLAIAEEKIQRIRKVPIHLLLEAVFSLLQLEPGVMTTRARRMEELESCAKLVRKAMKEV